MGLFTVVVMRVHKKYGKGSLLGIAAGLGSYGYRVPKVIPRLMLVRQLHQSSLIYVSVIRGHALVHRYRICLLDVVTS